MDFKGTGFEEMFKELPISKKKNEVKIGVICGGISSEREISLKTGKEIYKALLEEGYKTIFIDFKNEEFSLLRDIDIAFLALHGKNGEDGTVQGLLELLRIPYTGSGILSSALSIDKVYSKKIFKLEKINTPDYLVIENENIADDEETLCKISKDIGYPAVVKPAREGSTIGITIVSDESGLKNAICIAKTYDNKIFIEKYIKGRQFAVGIIGAEPAALPVIEIIPKSGFYDFESKYTPGMTEYIVPAMIEESLRQKLQDISVKTHKSLECYGISRVDLIVDEKEKPFVLEINTMPGMTETSLVPKAAAAAGIGFKKLVEIILNFSSLKQ